MRNRFAADDSRCKELSSRLQDSTAFATPGKGRFARGGAASAGVIGRRIARRPVGGNDGQGKGAARNLSTSSRPPSRDLYAGKLKREAVLIAFLRRMSQQSAFVVMGPGSRPGRRFVYDVLARHKSHRFNFQTIRHARAQLRDLAECFFREVFIYFPPSKQRAQGMPGARDLPICPSGQITCARTKGSGRVQRGWIGLRII